MSLLEGPAGSGKTTRLVDDLVGFLVEHPLRGYERVLALTKMHGSRRRMHDRLSRATKGRVRFDCLTVDGYAWHLLRRWRSLSSKRFRSECAAGDFSETCRRAA